MLASLQKSSCSWDTSVGESGDSRQASWVFESPVERLGLEAWRGGDWEEIQLGTWFKTEEKTVVFNVITENIKEMNVG